MRTGVKFQIAFTPAPTKLSATAWALYTGTVMMPMVISNRLIKSLKC